MCARPATWWTILRICIEERLVYRGDFILATLMRFLPILTQIFLWAAIFEAARAAGQTGGDGRIVGFSYGDMIAYYLLTMVSRAFSSMPGLASGITLEIREGTIKRFLIQPIDMVSFLLLSRIAHKLVYYVIAALPFALVFYLCRDFFPGWPRADIFAAYVLSLVMAFMLGFFLEATIGMIGFWFLEVSSLLFVYMLFNFFLSGHMFPLDVLKELPGPWYEIVRSLPLQYLAYFPATVFLGKVEGAELAWGLLMQGLWLIFFIMAARTAFYFGTRRYSAFGG